MSPRSSASTVARNKTDASASFHTPAHAPPRAPHTQACALEMHEPARAGGELRRQGQGRHTQGRTGPLPIRHRGFVAESRGFGELVSVCRWFAAKNTMVSCGASVPQSHATELSQGSAVSKSRDTSTTALLPRRGWGAMRAILRQGGRHAPVAAQSCGGVVRIGPRVPAHRQVMGAVSVQRWVVVFPAHRWARGIRATLTFTASSPGGRPPVAGWPVGPRLGAPNAGEVSHV